MSFTHAEQGTPERLWRESSLPVLPVLDLAALNARPEKQAAGSHPGDGRTLSGLTFIVLAAHPDDESLGAGSLMSQVIAAGATVEVILCTAGEASHPKSPTLSPRELASCRLLEFRTAMDVLGVGGNWLYLGVPDGQVAAHSDLIAGALRDRAARHRNDSQAVVLVAPYRFDGHTDHDALGSLAADTALAGGHALLEFVIWYWHWAVPDRHEWRSWKRVDATPQSRAAKDAALQTHKSQIAPLSPEPGDEALLHAGFLEHFERSFEVFALTPGRGLAEGQAGAEATATRHYGAADAEQIFDVVHSASADPWDYTGSWYEGRKRALTLAALPDKSYRSALEVGCSIGALTADLAPRCAALLAVDASGAALEHARSRLARLPQVRTQQVSVPADWPTGYFDLVVVSEVGYYLTLAELDMLVDRVAGAMLPGGTLLLCHWRHPIDGWALDGDTAHARIRQSLGWDVAGEYRERDFLVDVLVAPGARNDSAGAS